MKKYLVIGFYYNGNKKFRSVYCSYFQAMGINLWRGNVWEIEDGKRKLIKSVYN